MSLMSLHNLRVMRDRRAVVNEVSLTMEAGSLTGLIGPNGAGKSTFIACIAGQLPGVEGSVMFKGDNITTATPVDLARRGIGRTFQISRAFLDMSVLENLTSAFVIAKGAWFSLRGSVLSEAKDRAQTMLETVGLQERAAARVADLSLGDRKRLEFGMALANDPDLLLLDEPTAGMSIKERHHLMDLVAARIDETGKTLLFVEHDVDVVLKIATRVTVMVRGTVLAAGTPAEIAANEEVQAVYLGGHH